MSIANVQRDLKNRKLIAEVTVIVSLSLIYALVMVPKSYFSMNFLLTRIGDAAQYTDGSLGYLNDRWRWPIMHSNLLGLGGLSMSVFDAIPIAGILTKAINSIFDLKIQNYIGPWIFLVFFMQPLSAWIACRSWGITKHFSKVIVILTCMFLPSFQFRVLHTALQSHFLIILAFALFANIVKNKSQNKTIFLACALLFLTSFTHTYLTVMVFIILTLAYIECGIFKFLKSKKITEFIFSFQTILILGMLVLISFVNQELLTYPSGGGGWSVYSMNILSPFVIHGDKYVAGQYEGLNFIGPIGIIFCLMIAKTTKGFKNLALLDKNNFSRFTFYSMLVITMLSWGSLVYFGSYKIFDYRTFELLPGISSFVTSFRAPGRLFWITTYFILFAGGHIFDEYLKSSSIKVKSKTKNLHKSLWHNRKIYAGSFILLGMQLALFSPQLVGTYEYMRNKNYFQEDSKTLIPYVKGKSSVVIFPEYGCLPPYGRDIVPNFHITTSYLSIPINTTKAAREKVPYSCTESDMKRRLEKYLSNPEASALFVLAGDWAKESKFYLTDPVCKTYNGMDYCLGVKRFNTLP